MFILKAKKVIAFFIVAFPCSVHGSFFKIGIPCGDCTTIVFASDQTKETFGVRWEKRFVIYGVFNIKTPYDEVKLITSLPYTGLIGVFHSQRKGPKPFSLFPSGFTLDGRHFLMIFSYNSLGEISSENISAQGRISFLANMSELIDAPDNGVSIRSLGNDQYRFIFDLEQYELDQVLSFPEISNLVVISSSLSFEYQNSGVIERGYVVVAHFSPVIGNREQYHTHLLFMEMPTFSQESGGLSGEDKRCNKPLASGNNTNIDQITLDLQCRVTNYEACRRRFFSMGFREEEIVRNDRCFFYAMARWFEEHPEMREVAGFPDGQEINGDFLFDWISERARNDERIALNEDVLRVFAQNQIGQNLWVTDSMIRDVISRIFPIRFVVIQGGFQIEGVYYMDSYAEGEEKLIKESQWKEHQTDPTLYVIQAYDNHWNLLLPGSDSLSSTTAQSNIDTPSELERLVLSDPIEGSAQIEAVENPQQTRLTSAGAPIALLDDGFNESSSSNNDQEESLDSPEIRIVSGDPVEVSSASVERAEEIIINEAPRHNITSDQTGQPEASCPRSSRWKVFSNMKKKLMNIIHKQ